VAAHVFQLKERVDGMGIVPYRLKEALRTAENVTFRRRALFIDRRNEHFS
jgi:hypothetical protein